MSLIMHLFSNDQSIPLLNRTSSKVAGPQSGFPYFDARRIIMTARLTGVVHAPSPDVRNTTLMSLSPCNTRQRQPAQDPRRH